MKKIIWTGIQCLIRPIKVRVNPITILLELTSKCNLKCKMCPRTENISDNIDIDFALGEMILQEIQPHKVIFSGRGEPFLNKDILKFIEYAKSKGAYLKILTNGTLITPELAREVVKLGTDCIEFSVDAARPETYKRIRGADFHQVLSGIEAFSKIQRRNVTTLQANFAIQSDNSHEMLDFARLMTDLGVKRVNYQMLYFSQETRNKKEELIGDLRFPSIMDNLKKLGKDTHLPKITWNVNIKEEGNNRQRNCIQPWYTTNICSNGDVVPCCLLMLFEQPIQRAVMGNLHQASNFMSIYNGSKYQHFRKQVKSGTCPLFTCKTCSFFGQREIIKAVPKFLFRTLRSRIFKKKEDLNHEFQSI